MARLWRVYHPELPSTAGASVELGESEGEHLSRVLRLRPGEQVAVFDGAGNEWRAAVLRCDRKRVAVRLEEPVSEVVDPEFEVVLHQGLCKPDRMDWLVQKATEVGVAAVLVFAAERTGPCTATSHRLARWRRIALEACKQSGRRRVPRIDSCQGLPVPPPSGVLCLLLDAGRSVPPLASVCAASGRPASGVWMAVGPEGGFESGEIEPWEEAGWRRAGLGPRTLRAETAGIVATSIVLHLWADLGAADAAHGDC
jgi:16S rRNA (uracil1498-N3)-methyltransferase